MPCIQNLNARWSESVIFQFVLRCDVMWCDVMWCDVMWCDVVFIWRIIHVNALMRLTIAEKPERWDRTSAYIGAHCCHFRPCMISPHPTQTSCSDQHKSDRPWHRVLRSLLFSNSIMGSFTSHMTKISESALRRGLRFIVLIREDFLLSRDMSTILCKYYFNVPEETSTIL